MPEQTQQRLKSLSITGLRRLKDLNISFEDKDVTGIFGVNGCGKTTLLYTLLCLYNQKNSAFQFNFGDFFKKCSSNEFDDTEINAEVSFRIGIDIHDTNGPIKNQQEVIVGHQKHQDGRKGKCISWVYLQVFLQ